MILFKYDEIKMQKNRFHKNPKKIKLTFGEFGFLSTNEGRIELIQLSILKKNMKIFVKKKKSRIDVIREKIWYFCTPNFILQKKSKNSRMGKGKGLNERHVIRVRKNTTIFEFSGISLYRLEQLLLRINKKLNIKLVLLKKRINSYKIWSKKNKYLYYYNKYLFY
jgi:ribosomal protein L16/L10AE